MEQVMEMNVVVDNLQGAPPNGSLPFELKHQEQDLGSIFRCFRRDGYKCNLLFQVDTRCTGLHCYGIDVGPHWPQWLVPEIN